MEALVWFGSNWPDLLQIAGLFLAVYSLRDETRERRIQNLFTLTAAHRDLWTKLYEKPELERVISENPDLEKTPVSREEDLFVHLLILHLGAWFKARSLGSDPNDDAVSADIRQFFARPIPHAVWIRSRRFQDPDLVEFVDGSIKAKVGE